MDIKIRKLIELVALVQNTDKEILNARCLIGDLKTMRYAIDDLVQRISERKKMGTNGPKICLSDDKQMVLAKNLEVLDRVLELSDQIIEDMVMFEVEKAEVEQILEDPEAIPLDLINGHIKLASNMQRDYTGFNSIAEELEKDLFDSINSVTIGGKPYIDVSGFIENVPS